jgi:ribosome-binding protein aMBF1 (putative translation factor)
VCRSDARRSPVAARAERLKRLTVSIAPRSATSTLSVTLLGATVHDVRAALGARINELRRRLGISEEELAHRASLHWTYVGDLERCRQSPTVDVVNRLTRAFGVAASLRGVTTASVTQKSRNVALLGAQTE